MSLPHQANMYVFVKLDTWSCLRLREDKGLPEYARTDEFLLCSKFNKKDIGRLRDNSVDLVPLSIESPGYEPVSSNIGMVGRRSILESWPFRKHDHFTIA